MVCLGIEGIQAGELGMAGTRTAPVVGALTMTQSSATMHLIDASGDLHAEGVVAPADGLADLADVQAVSNTYQLASNASLYKVTQTLTWEGDADPDNAVALYRATVAEGINLLYKNITTLKTQTPRLVAPIAAVLQGNQDIPLLTAAEMTALIAALSAVLTGYNLSSAQFTGRKEASNNPRIKA